MDSSVPADQLPLQRLYHWERQAPQRITLSQPLDGGRLQEFTWAQVADGARRMAAHLRAQDWPPGSAVAIVSKNCVWWLLSDLAIWMAGHVSVPLYPTLTPASIAQLLEHSGARACFIGKLDGWESMCTGIAADLPCIAYPVAPEDARLRYEGWDAICTRTLPLASEPVRDAQELATLMYTSGTTGQPKGVMHSFATLAWAAHAGNQRLALHAEDRMLSYLPLAHMTERLLVEHGWLISGMHLFFAESLQTFAADLRRARPTVFFSVPRLWVKFQQNIHARLPPQRLDRLLGTPLLGRLLRRRILHTMGLDRCRLAAGGAAPMPQALLAWYRGLGLPIAEGYGMTEVGISHTTLPGRNQEGSVGPALEGVHTRVDAQTSELLLHSPALMLGYYKEPQLTRAAFTEDGWLRTGDQASEDASGCLRITGRVKDQFKTSKGKYVAPAPIEDRLAMHPAVEACLVTGANLAQPLGLVLLSPEALARAGDAQHRPQLLASLARHLDELNTRLDPHERLDRLVLLQTPWSVDNGLVTPTFKLKRQSIEALYAPQLAQWAAAREPVLFGD
ncbi:MAG: AMP-binding protein [Comamonas sp.]|nr:AMP-binding protein [Comamonas sp.]